MNSNGADQSLNDTNSTVDTSIGEPDSRSRSDSAPEGSTDARDSFYELLLSFFGNNITNDDRRTHYGKGQVPHPRQMRIIPIKDAN